MMRNVKRWTLALTLLLGGLLATPSPVHAEDDDIPNDARLEGYTNIKLKVEDDGTSLVWFLFIILSCISCGVMFMNAKRTHLD